LNLRTSRIGTKGIASEAYRQQIQYNIITISNAPFQATLLKARGKLLGYSVLLKSQAFRADLNELIVF
jgi:hypothetical protein